MDVVDNTDSSLARQYGRKYPITLSETASINSVVSFLAPDKRRVKVVVRWKDGEVEPLDDQVPIKELKKYGKYIEVKEKKKVRFA
ncbi:Fc.00g008710.m01.CDS01 [Cosmosporella sp. VM-42]